MQITTEELNNIEMISVKGRVDSVEAARLEQALEGAHRRGRYKLVIDMSQLEYMSSAGFRALAAAQRNCLHENRGEVVLTQVPERVHEALEMVGFTEYFKIINPPSAALQYADNIPSRDSPSNPHSASSKT